MIDASVPAGVPVSAIDVGSQPLVFDEYLVKKPNETFVIPIKGDSMLEAGIFDGDLAVVERSSKARRYPLSSRWLHGLKWMARCTAMWLWMEMPARL